ncbi:MAG: CAP domain-containing protein, partial [Trueperaceae bacterium]|nr:CAP domain-containing protein [Trueperaceae bacterium]
LDQLRELWSMRKMLRYAVGKFGRPVAEYARGAADPATTTVQGWLDSPGHRANLLHPPFDRVGFGSAEDGRGGLYLVQVLAAVPWTPSAFAASLEPTLRRTVTLEVRADLPEPVVGLLELDGRGERVTWSPGATRLERPLDGPGPTTVRLAVDVGRPAFTLDEAGEVDAAGRWRPAAAPRTWLEVVAAEVRTDVVLVARVRFEFAPEVGAELIVDGVHHPEARSGEGALAFAGALADGEAIAFALAEPDGAGGLIVRHQMALVRQGADVAWRVRP